MTIDISTAPKMRGNAGPLGKGTPGSRLKSVRTMPLRAFARLHASSPGSPHRADAVAWMKSKGVHLAIESK